MQITSISKFRQNLPQINKELHQKTASKTKNPSSNYVVVIQNSEPAGVYTTWEQWQEIQQILENTEYQNMLKASKSFNNFEDDGDENS